jgi:hypothetical protein
MAEQRRIHIAGLVRIAPRGYRVVRQSEDAGEYAVKRLNPMRS